MSVVSALQDEKYESIYQNDQNGEHGRVAPADFIGQWYEHMNGLKIVFTYNFGFSSFFLKNCC